MKSYNVCFTTRCNVWILNCALTDTNKLTHKTVCSDHFDPACYIVNTNRLIKTAVPTIFTPVENTQQTVNMSPDTFLRPVDLFPKTPEVPNILHSCSRNCSTPNPSTSINPILSNCSIPDLSISPNCSMPDISTSSDCSTPLSSG